MAKKKKKSGRGVKTVVAAAVVTAAGVLVLLALFGDNVFKPSGVRDETGRSASVREVNLFFADTAGEGLRPEARNIRRGALEEEVTRALEALIRGPQTGLYATIPKGTTLLGVDVKGAVAFVNLSGEVVSNHPGGSTGELQTVYSIVDTVVLNFPTIDGVQIMVEGRSVPTLAGHIDITGPLGPDRGVIIDYTERKTGTEI